MSKETKKNIWSMLDAAAKVIPLTREDHQNAITTILSRIEDIEQQINAETALIEKRKLKRKKNELQYMNLWHMEQLEKIGNQKAPGGED